MQEAVVNISFAGNPIDTSNVRAFVGESATGTYVDASSASIVGGGGGGFAPVTWAFTYDLSAVGQGFQSLSFFFGSELANSSLDAISIDVLGSAVIPGPGALALLGVAGIGARRRRR
jgi:MYXO-CTERM domain-containing protein